MLIPMTIVLTATGIDDASPCAAADAGIDNIAIVDLVDLLEVRSWPGPDSQEPIAGRIETRHIVDAATTYKALKLARWNGKRHIQTL